MKQSVRLKARIAGSLRQSDGRLVAAEGCESHPLGPEVDDDGTGLTLVEQLDAETVAGFAQGRANLLFDGKLCVGGDDDAGLHYLDKFRKHRVIVGVLVADDELALKGVPGQGGEEVFLGSKSGVVAPEDAMGANVDSGDDGVVVGPGTSPVWGWEKDFDMGDERRVGSDDEVFGRVNLMPVVGREVEDAGTFEGGGDLAQSVVRY